MERKDLITCRCGAVQLELTGNPTVQFYCPCEGLFRPEFHMQCQFAVRPAQDTLPHYKSRPARFGGSDETVEW